MLKKKKILILIILAIVFLASPNYSKVYREAKINKVLKNNYYKKLPVEAKESIEKVYKETGEVVSTKENKSDNEPYLNPKYVKYLNLSDEEKAKAGVVPKMYTVDYDYSNVKKSTEAVESSYDLRNYNYITPLKDQSTLNICWAFATTEQAESFLRVNGGSTKVFSPRQLDYALSTDGFLNYQNDLGTRKLTTGGNFYDTSEFLELGLALVDESKMPFNTNADKKELYDVLNFANSNYEVNNTFNMPNLSSGGSSSNLILAIKNGIKQYGGAVVETLSPQGVCGFKNTNNTYALDTNETCDIGETGHAMQLIGWNDNYSYSYCKANGKNYNVNSNGTCSTGTKTYGTGAFIVRNSWGNDANYSYVYLTYNSFNTSDNTSQAYFITNMTPTANRTWKNYYKNISDNLDVIYLVSSDSQSFQKKISSSEKLQKVKVTTFTSNATYSVDVIANGKTYTYKDILSTTYPGVYTIDLANKNIVIDSDTFTVRVYSSNGRVIMYSMAAFTSNVDNSPRIKADNPQQIVLDFAKYYSGKFLYNTKGIESNQTVNFSLQSIYGEDYTNYLNVNYSKVSNNKVNPSIGIVPLPYGDYKLIASYGNARSEEITVKVGGYDVSIYYHSNDGTNTKIVRSFKKNTSLTLLGNTFTRTGYTFKEWNTKADGTGTSYQASSTLSSGISSNMNLYAIWQPNLYTVNFNVNGGTTVSSQNVYYGNKATRPTSTRANYTLIGWCTDSSLNNIFDFNSPVTGSMTLYAKWVNNSSLIPVYRMYNPRTGEHLYTADAHEVDVIYKTLGWGFEGVGWYTINSGTPVYRLYSPKFDNHLYTSDQNEMNVITSKYGWVFDNVRNGVPQPVMYSNGDTIIYRLYNPGQNDQHHLTTDKNEYDIIPKWGWRQEGVSMKAASLGIPVITYYYKDSHRDIDFNNIKNNKL